MHIYCFLKNKLRCKKVHFSQFLKDPLQFIKITCIGCINCFEKKSTSTVFVRFLKNTDFTRSCAFAQKAKFYALKMLKNKISRILKLPSWQHCWSAVITTVDHDCDCGSVGTGSTDIRR